MMGMLQYLRTVGIVLCMLSACSACSRDPGAAWQLSTANGPGGLVLTVSTARMPKAVYTIEIAGVTTEQPMTALSRPQLVDAEEYGVKTLFYDETILPGRWTIEVHGITIDIMESRAVVNRQHECLPGQTVQIRLTESIASESIP